MSGRKKKPGLSNSDRQLWKRVADTTTPLSQERGKILKDEMTKLMEGTVQLPFEPASNRPPKSHKALQKDSAFANATGAHGIPNRKPNTSFAPEINPIEDKTVKNLTKGKVQIDSRIDLHGMTQDRARYALMDFLQMAQKSGDRIVLVITGKGNEGRGVLRANVPRWLALPEFSGLVNGFRTSHPAHGGDGALYVRLRKRTLRFQR